MEHYKIRKRCISNLTINNHKHAKHNIAKFFSSVKLDIYFCKILVYSLQCHIPVFSHFSKMYKNIILYSHSLFCASCLNKVTKLIKSLINSLHYAEARRTCKGSKFTGFISMSLHPTNTALFKEMLQH